mmetsp:Transcript_645/g.1534  ORF Transcript_645/g.1534 Transcript_645/m.1534 type:complete len:261 (+) Transcript_645:469-1251(+)
MNVIFHPIDTRWHVEVDNDSDVLDIKSSCSHIGGNQHSQCSVFEGIHDFRTLPLRPVSVQAVYGKSIVPQLVGEVVATDFFRDKDNHLGVCLSTVGDSALAVVCCPVRDKLLENGLQLIDLFFFVDHMNDLLDVFVGYQGVDFTDVDLNRIPQKIVGQSLDFFWPGSRKEQRLSSLGICFFDNGANLRFETHIQHAIGFVQDQVLDARKVAFSHFDQVVQSTGTGDDTLDTPLQGLNLRILGGSPVATDGSDADRIAKLS